MDGCFWSSSPLVPKLCLGTHVRETSFPDPGISQTRNGVSRACVPKRSLGTRNWSSPTRSVPQPLEPALERRRLGAARRSRPQGLQVTARSLAQAALEVVRASAFAAHHAAVTVEQQFD